MASGLVGTDGAPITSETPSGKPQPFPGLDMQNPVQTLDLLGVIARGGYITGQQFAFLAGPKGERHVKIEARQHAILAQQIAAISEFSSNVLSELTFTLAEAEARIRILEGFVSEDKVQVAKQADADLGVEWENRRRFFALKVGVLIKSRKPIGPALAEIISGSAPGEAEFAGLRKEAQELGLIKEEGGPPQEEQASAPAETDSTTVDEQGPAAEEQKS